MAPEPESLILQLLRDMRAEISDMRADVADVRTQMATIGELAALKSELKSDMHSHRADMAADLLTTRKELGEQIVGVRRAVIEYHTTVIGHGVLISDLEGRLRRVEQHLDLA
jgi:hypothetical protein